MRTAQLSREANALDFERVLGIVSGFFEQDGAAFAVIGAFGLHAYGRTRATQDIDFVTEASVQPRLLTFLENLGYETLYQSKGYSNYLHNDPSCAQRRYRGFPPLDLAGYLKFLKSFGPTDPADLRSRKGPRGDKPFVLPSTD